MGDWFAVIFLVDLVMELIIWTATDTTRSTFQRNNASSAGSSNDPPAFRVMDWVAFAIVGAVVGAVSALVLPERVLPAAPIEGTSLVASPLLIGACMYAVGHWRRANGYAASFLTTFWGSAWLAFWIACARFVFVHPGIVAY